MILAKLISSDAYTPVNKTIAKNFGFVTAGYFGELVRQRERFGQDEFYFSQAQMTEEIGISEHDQRTALKKLIESGFVGTEKKGMPSKYFFRIFDDTVLEFFKLQCSKIGSTSGAESEGLVPENLKHKYKKSDTKKEEKEIIYTRIFDFWNCQKIIVHEKVTSVIQKAINKALTDYTTEEIERGIKHYSEILHSDKTFFTYKWTLSDFITRANGLSNFIFKTVDDYLKDEIKDPKKAKNKEISQKIQEQKRVDQIVAKNEEEDRIAEQKAERIKHEKEQAFLWYDRMDEESTLRKKIDTEINDSGLLEKIIDQPLPDPEVGETLLQKNIRESRIAWNNRLRREVKGGVAYAYYMEARKASI